MSFSSRESSSRSEANKQRSPSGAVDDGASGNGGGGNGITLVDLFDRVAWDEVGVESAVNVEVSGLARLGADVDEPEASAARDEAVEDEDAPTSVRGVVSAAALAAVVIDVFPRPLSPAAFRAAGGAADATACARAA